MVCTVVRLPSNYALLLPVFFPPSSIRRVWVWSESPILFDAPNYIGH